MSTLEIHPKMSKRGQKRCPKCLTLQSNRAVFCKGKGCDNSFNINVKRKPTTSACKLLTNDSSRFVYSVRLLTSGPDYRGFVEHQRYSNTRNNFEQNGKSVVKCLVDSCLKKTQSEPPICSHIESTLNCFTQAEVLSISLDILVQLKIPPLAEAAIEKRLKGSLNCLVQRVSRQVMVVDNSLNPADPIDLKHCSFYSVNVLPDKFGSKHRFSCSCRSHIKKKSISTKRGRPLKQVQNHAKSKKITTSPGKCWHYYACIAAFASHHHLAKEFHSYIRLCGINLLQTSDECSPEYITCDVDLAGNTMVMDCDSDIFDMTDLNLDPCLNKNYDMSAYPLSTIILPNDGNSRALNLEDSESGNTKDVCFKITDMDILTNNLPIKICSKEELITSNDNVNNNMFSPVKIFDVFTSNIDNFLSTSGDNITDQSSIEIITLNKVENMVKSSIEFDIHNEVTVGNEIDQAILLNDDNMFIQLNDRDTLVFPEDEDIRSDGTFDLQCTDNISQASIAIDNIDNSPNKTISLNTSVPNSNTKLGKKSKSNVDKSIYDGSKLKDKLSVKSSTLIVTNADTCNSLVKELQLNFLDWLASVTERINDTMHFQLVSGKPDPLVFFVDQRFFQSLCARMSTDLSKHRLPDITSRYEPNKPPFGSFTMFTWRLTNIFRIKNIFETPKVPLKLTRVFTRNPNGTYKASIEQNLKNSELEKNGPKRQDLVMTYLKIDKSIPFCIEWIPDMFPVTKTGELRLIFEFGHRRIIRV